MLERTLNDTLITLILIKSIIFCIPLYSPYYFSRVERVRSSKVFCFNLATLTIITLVLIQMYIFCYKYVLHITAIFYKEMNE